MKKVIMVLLLVLFPLSVLAATVEVSWNANPPADEVTAYKVYYKKVSDSAYPETPAATVAGNIIAVEIANVRPGKYDFIVIACDAADNTSDPSNPAYQRIPLTTVKEVKVIVKN